MNFKTIAVLALATAASVTAFAKTTKDYQRPSLHMVLMTSSEDATKGTIAISDKEILGYASDAWKTYAFPALYNDFRVETKSVEVGTAKGSIMDLLAMYSDPASTANLGINELKAIVEMTKGKAYLDSLKKEVDKVTDQVAHELVQKWWSISPDGSCSDTLLFRLSCYSANQNQAADAAQSTIGAQVELFNELSNSTMSNTFITFTKLDFYENEPIAKFIYKMMNNVASMTPSPLDVAISASATAAYNASREGYTAFAHALLYQLEWNDSIANEFYNIWTDGSHIDMEKFNAMKFNLKFIGSTKSSATCMMKKEDKGKGAKEMVEKTIYKALNHQFADMQKAYEEFRPMVPVLGIDAKGGIIADMGTKEGVKIGDNFQLLAPEVNQKGILKYKYVGTVKVVKWSGDQFDKTGVWDNENIDNALQADTEGNDGMEIIGTHMSKFKNATPSMFVKRTKK